MEAKALELRALITKNEHTLRSFTKDSNIPLSYLSLIVSKKAKPSLKMAKKIADNLNVDMEELFIYRTRETQLMIKQLFNNKEIRFIEKNGEYWAIATDVAKVLGFRDAHAAVRALLEYVRDTLKVRITSDKKKSRKLQDYTVINEKGIYRLIMRSNKIEALDFQDWTCDVLVKLRISTELKEYEVFHTLNKEKQNEAMNNLKSGIEAIPKKDYCKAQTISSKTVLNVFGFPKMIQKEDMIQEMLRLRQQVLNNTVEFMVFVNKYKLPLSVSKYIYDKYSSKYQVV